MGDKQLGEILMVGTVYIHWENGEKTAVGSVKTFVKMTLSDDEPVTISSEVDTA